MSFIRKFVRLNRKYAHALVPKYPWFFGWLIYREDFLRRIHAYIDSGTVKSVLEVGGIDRPLLKRAGGFQYVDFKVYYQAKDYLAFFLPFYILISAFENACRALDLQLHTSW